MCSVLIASLGQQTSGQQSGPARQTAPGKPAPARRAAAEPSSPSQWLSINVVRVKADMLTEYQEFVRNEANPALKKGGMKERHAYTTGVFGEAYEYVYVTPIENFANYDGPSAVVKALGEEGARSFGAKARRFVASSRTFAVRTRPDLSIEGSTTNPPKLAVINTITVVPGKNLEFEALFKNELLPVAKKMGVTALLVSQTVVGGNTNEYTAIGLFDSFAEVSKGSPLVRGLGGPEGFNRFLLKFTGIVASHERTIARFVPDMSFTAAAPAK